MNGIIEILHTAYNPNSEQFQNARNELIEMRDTNPELLLMKINESFQSILSYPEQSILYLLIFSRECFSSNFRNYPFNPSVLFQYESIILTLMHDFREKVRYHSSISLGVYSVFRIQSEKDFLTHILQNLSDLTVDFYYSFETSLLHIIQEIDLSTRQNKQIFDFIFPRIASDGVTTNEKTKCLLILSYQSQDFIDFLNETEYPALITFLVNLTIQPEFSLFLYKIWSQITLCKANSLPIEIFNQLIEISFSILSSISEDPDQLHLKTEIFTFLAFSFLSDSEINVQNVPKLIELTVANFYLPSLIENDSDNMLIDCLNPLLSSILSRFPQETTTIFTHFIDSYLLDENHTNQYTAIDLYLLLLNNDFDPMQSPQIIQIALRSEIPQIIILGLNILLYITTHYYEKMINHIDFIFYLKECINYLKSENVFLISDASSVIISIISSLQKVVNNQTFDLSVIIQEIMNLISSSPALHYIELLCDLVPFVNDVDSLIGIYQFGFGLSIKLFENIMKNGLSGTCHLFSAIFKQFSSLKIVFPVDECKNLFSFLVNIQNTEIGDDALETIGDMASCLKDDFKEMIETAYQLAFDNIDRNQFVRASLICITKLLIAMNSSTKIVEIYKRIIPILDDPQSFGQDYVFSFDIFKVFLLLYYDYLVSDQNGIELIANMITYMNDAALNINAFVKEDKETAVELSFSVYRSYSRLIDKDPAQYFPLFSDAFPLNVSFLITALFDENNDAILPVSLPASIIYTMSKLAQTFGAQLKEPLENSTICQFLSALLSNDDQNEKIVTKVKQIFTDLGFTLN